MVRTDQRQNSPDDGQKRAFVKEMFTAIAPRYDLLNHVLSLNIDKGWRRRTVSKLDWESNPEGAFLDVCSGTMDLAHELAGRDAFRGKVVGADFVVPMLKLGLTKYPSLTAVGADALSLPFPDASFDGCTVGFGVRNLTDIGAGIREMGRVLKPGATLAVLEFSTPKWPGIKTLYLWYFRHVLPWIGRVVSKHTTAYRYLPDSVMDFPDPETFSE
ncbi:MAG: ubiquinone/menaquinone biosynthesis methyltransferase, partial [Gemmatimonadota bacterium]|nr:ubiquinone/menaquinone biosynthesis methyltransferase [Gemmatimonadota bacterium]